MKLLPFMLLLFTFYSSFSQQETFQIEGQITGLNGDPVADVYIINYRDLDKNITNTNGVFSIWVLPTDSVIISHISYFRKVVTVHSLLTNPIIRLQLDTINIQDVNVSPNQKTDYDRAKENIEFIEKMEFPVYSKIEQDPDPVLEMATENNRIMRTEASSISIIRFSPGELIGKLINKRKRRKESKQFKSTKKKKRE